MMIGYDTINLVTWVLRALSIAQKLMVDGLTLMYNNDSICKICMLGKHHKDFFLRNSNWRAKEQLEVIHACWCIWVDADIVAQRQLLLCDIHGWLQPNDLGLFSSKINPMFLIFFKN